MRCAAVGVWPAVAAVTVTVVSGCGAADTQPGPTTTSAVSTPSSTPPPAPPTQPARIAKWFELQPGDCLAGPPPTDPAVVEVTLVDCATPHLAETFLRAEIPVNAAVGETGNAQCEAGFTPYTGMALTASPYTIAYLIDSEQDRTTNNPFPSTVICLLQGAQGQSLTGSARG
ncbi:MAG: hypothetical protein K8R24_02635 [Mycobacterium sp.]|nr:hypothetical protein [Mycobacterium sp.]